MVAVGVIVVIATLLIGLSAVGSAIVARHRAQSAADLAALAAAGALVSGLTDPCAKAESLLNRQEGGPHLESCDIAGSDVQVRVSVPVNLGRWGLSEAVAVARAGPVE